MLLIFANLKIKSFWRRIIAYVSPATFGVYLIHVQPLIFENVLSKKFTYIEQYELYQIPLVVIGWAILIFMIGIIIEKIREGLFQFMKVDKLTENLEKRVLKII